MIGRDADTLFQINHYNFPTPTTGSIDWVALAVSVLSSLTTLALAFVTYKSVKENVADRRLRAQPNIVVDFEICEQYLFQLVVKNISPNPAYKVEIMIFPTIDNPFQYLDSLSPGVEMRHTIIEIRKNAMEEIAVKHYTIFIEYTDLYQKKQPKIEVEKDVTALLTTYKDAKATPEDELRNDIRNLANAIDRSLSCKN